MEAKGSQVQSKDAIQASARAATKGCMVRYDELKRLESDVVAVYKKVKSIGDMGYKFLGFQRTIRQWIVNLPVGCPDEDKLSKIREEVEDEYAKRVSP